MEKITVESPAKINLGLNVIRKRIDGFHDLETIFLPLMLSDKITFNKSELTIIQCNSELLNRTEDNLIYKALKVLEEKVNMSLKMEVSIEKNIPIGGGLGGGSSNAAITLKAVNKIYNLGLTYKELAEIALNLGSDVPYFLNPVPCYTESRGEILHSLNLELPYPILIVNPGIKISTAWAFSKIKPLEPLKNLRDIFENDLWDFNILNDFVKNDFEDIVFAEFPVIKRIKEDLYSQGAQFALMSGTGSTVYGIFTNLQKALWAEDYFQQRYFTYLNNPFTKGSIT
jgi:4-diphosphocytidyl-2-C-methyl-D-erythritol kinase